MQMPPLPRDAVPWVLICHHPSRPLSPTATRLRPKAQGWPARGPTLGKLPFILPVPNRNAVASQSPGLARPRAYPGKTSVHFPCPQPQRGCVPKPRVGPPAGLPWGNFRSFSLSPTATRLRPKAQGWPACGPTLGKRLPKRIQPQRGCAILGVVCEPAPLRPRMPPPRSNL